MRERETEREREREREREQTEWRNFSEKIKFEKLQLQWRNFSIFSVRMQCVLTNSKYGPVNSSEENNFRGRESEREQNAGIFRGKNKIPLNPTSTEELFSHFTRMQCV